jgi:NADPH-dependent 2,4-dienoyl-CoA reductase/sulfur reductase-like enzyme
MRCALELRAQGHDGPICILSAETTPPYDRTLVSKDLLAGDRVNDARLLLQPGEAYEDAAIDLRLGVRATGLDVRTRRVDLGDGTQLRAASRARFRRSPAGDRRRRGGGLRRRSPADPARRSASRGRHRAAAGR